MKPRSLYFFLFILGVFLSTSVFGEKSAFQKKLEQLPEVKSVQAIEHLPFFAEAYEIMIEQYIDHENLSKGKFLQRVVLSQYNPFSPVVFVTEGYDANYATKPKYANELSTILNANQIVVEHRFFGKSMPESLNWDYQTTENACADLHRIYKIFSRIYSSKNKWIGTGISNGGTHTLCYYALYPEDMHIWIPYVAPINFAVEDGRHEPFLKQVGSSKCREKIFEFQKRVLQERETIIPMLDSLSKAKSYTYYIPMNEVLDYCVLEYSFAFWQWGTDCSTIPADTLGAKADFEHLVNICDPDYFSIEGTKPTLGFFVQAQKQLGYYGYDTEDLAPYLSIKSAKGYLKRVFLPEFSYSYSNKISKKVVKSINKNGHRVMMIYGEYDPWSSTGVTPRKKSQAIKVVSPRACHRARIENLPISIKKDVYITLETWLEED